MHLKSVIRVSSESIEILSLMTYSIGYKPKFAEPFSSKRHRDNEDTLSSLTSINGAISPPYRQKMSSSKQHPSPLSNFNDHRPSPPPLLPLLTRSLPNTELSSLFGSFKIRIDCFFLFRSIIYTFTSE